MAQAEAAREPEVSEALPSEAAQRLRRELRVLQLELELQQEVLERAERDRAESVRRARNFTELSPVGIFRTDEAGATTYVNPRWCELAGLGAEEALGSGWLAAVHPEDRDHLIEGWREASTRHEPSRAEYRLLHRDGSIVSVIGQATPERDGGGRVVGYIGTIVDITERTRAEEALRESNMLLSLFIQHSPIYAFIKDVRPGESRVLIASENYRDMVGIPGSEMAGKTMEELFPSEFAAKITADDWAVVSNGTILNLDEELNGRSYTTIKFPIALGGRHLLAGYTIDITDRKRAEEALAHSRAQLLQAQKLEALGRLAGGVAHDFNNILQALLSLATVLQLKVASPELAKVVAEIEAHVTRGASLTQQLLLFSRRQSTEKKRVDLAELAGAVGVLLRRLIPENVRLVVDSAGQPLWVEADAGQLQQVLMNLAVNAKDAMPGGGTLIVRAFGGSGHAALEVSDTGHGMDDATRAHLFEPFFTTKETGKGTGLGLSVVHGIVEQHGGRVEVESSPGKGSCFRVVLPSAAAPETELGKPISEKDMPGGRGERVLVVEDEDGAREGLAELLAMLGYGVTAVASGEEARAAANEAAPELLLTDLMLPGVDGAALAAELRRRWPGLRVVLMSGYTEDEAVRRGIDEGSVYFLQKPFDVRSLAHAVSAALTAPARGDGGQEHPDHPDP